MKTADPYLVLRSLALLTAVVSGGCEVSKSSNPLSPTVAGPIPGVSITAPTPVEPATGQKIEADKQPITLTVQNATTSGVRPLSYAFEIATDVKFAHKVFTRDKVTSGDGGKTSLRLPDALATGRTYYWRALAQDGANTGDYAEGVNFDIYTPIVINAPSPLSPAENSTVNTVRPPFTVANATRSGPVGAINYFFELSDDYSFATRVATLTTAEMAGQTTFHLAADSRVLEDLLLACPRVRPDDQRAVVPRVGVQYTGPTRRHADQPEQSGGCRRLRLALRANPRVADGRRQLAGDDDHYVAVGAAGRRVGGILEEVGAGPMARRHSSRLERASAVHALDRDEPGRSVAHVQSDRVLVRTRGQRRRHHRQQSDRGELDVLLRTDGASAAAR